MEENQKIFAELLKVAEEQLPKTTSDLFRKRLDKLDRLEQEYEALEARYQESISHNQKLLQEIGELRILKSKEKTLNDMEADLKSREEELWKKNMEKEIDCLRTINNHIVGFTQGLIRNTEFRKEVFNNRSYCDEQGIYKTDTTNTTEHAVQE